MLFTMRFDGFESNQPELKSLELSIRERIKSALVPIARASIRGVLTCIVGLSYQQAELIAQKIEDRISVLREP